MYKPISERKVIKILCRDFEFYFISQKGSHVKLRKRINHKEITTIVPLYKELAPGTLKGVLKLAQIEENDFWSRI
jgi:predicted RNA binding protein YcfA (HicA-like mRNA interferase family)